MPVRLRLACLQYPWGVGVQIHHMLVGGVLLMALVVLVLLLLQAVVL
jgi:hypothetical protein